MSEAEQPPPPAEEKKRPFQFGLSTLFIVMTLWAVFCTIAATFGLGWGIMLAVLAVWLAVIIRAFIRKQYVSGCVQSLLFLLFLLLFIGLPWFHAYRSYASASGYLGVEEGRQIRFIYVDKTHFDAHKTALWFDESLSITAQDGVISCNGRRIDFPKGKNVVLVHGVENLTFVELGERYFREEARYSELIYILGKVPHFKEKDKGRIDLQKVKDDQVIQEEWAAFLGPSPSTEEE